MSKTLRLTSPQVSALMSALEHYLEVVDPEDTDAEDVLSMLGEV